MLSANTWSYHIGRYCSSDHNQDVALPWRKMITYLKKQTIHNISKHVKKPNLQCEFSYNYIALFLNRNIYI